MRRASEKVPRGDIELSDSENNSNDGGKRSVSQHGSKSTTWKQVMTIGK